MIGEPLNVGAKKARKQMSITDILRTIPSSIMTAEQMETERKLSLQSRSKRSEMSRVHNEQRMLSIATELSSLNEEKAPIVVKGKGALSLCYETGIDQLSCEYNEDYSLFAAGGSDGVVRLYETNNFNFVKSIRGGKDTEGLTACVTCIKHKPVLKSESVDNQFTFTYVNGIVKCFNYKTLECLFTINEKRQTYGVAFHPRLHKFITYGDDLKINLYDYETQAKERIFKRSGKSSEHDGHTSRVFAAQFNPASNAEFLTGSWDSTVFLWDLRRPLGIRYISDVHICGEGLDIDKAGRQVLTCSWRKENQLQLWDYSTFKLISTITPDNFPSKLYCGRFVGSDYIACGGGTPSLFRLLDMNSGKSKFVATNLPYDVYHCTVGKSKHVEPAAMRKKKRSKQLEPTDIQMSLTDLTNVPDVMCVAGDRIYKADFSSH